MRVHPEQSVQYVEAVRRAWEVLQAADPGGGRLQLEQTSDLPRAPLRLWVESAEYWIPIHPADRHFGTMGLPSEAPLVFGLVPAAKRQDLYDGQYIIFETFEELLDFIREYPMSG